MSLRVLSVFGTRPEAIKMAPVVRVLEADARFDSRVCVTGQHREMLDSALATFELRPHHDLAVMHSGQDLCDVTSRVLLGLREVLRAERPELVLVHGDTTTCLAASLAAFYERVPVGHVEAGLRSHDLARPFPEELNRRVADCVAAVCFAPTEGARANLLGEGVPCERVFVTGNTGLDALRLVRERVRARSPLEFARHLGPELAARLECADQALVLVTGHRREGFGGGVERICAVLAAVARREPRTLFVWPVHKNPRVSMPVHAALRDTPNVLLCEPLDYEPFVWLMDRARVIVTDSGGIQEEAPSLGKPVLVTRDVTERPEALEAGTVRLVGADGATLERELTALLHDPDLHARMARAHNPYGDGHAAERIADLCARLFHPSAAARAA